MSKQEQYFRIIVQYKERFRQLPTETLKRRLDNGFLYKEATIAIRELLEESNNFLKKAAQRAYVLSKA